MINRLLIFFLLSGSLCAGQAVQTAPENGAVACPTGPGPVSAAESAECLPGYSPTPAAATVPAPFGRTPALATEAGQAPSGLAPAPTQPTVTSARVVGPLTSR